jgi:hypothetical protein
MFHLRARARHGTPVLSLLLPLAPCIAAADEPQSVAPCALRLSVELTPDVPDPGDGGFVSSLLGDHTGFRLILRRVVDDTHIDLDLSGPGPDDNCRDVVKSMREDGRVLSVHAR